MKQLTFLALIIFALPCLAQVTFEDHSLIYNPDLDLRSGNTGAIVDLNKDGFPEIITIDKGNQLYIGYNQGDGETMDWKKGPKVSSSREYLCLITDLNNDGKHEMITSGSFSNSKVYNLDEEGIFEYDYLIKKHILAQGGNTVDIDNNGFIDYFLCSDESDNLIALNREGILEEEEGVIDWTTIPESDNSGNYSSEWADVNGDGLLDLMIAKCRAGVTDLDNPRRINRLFIQNEDGSFSDQANERGVASPYQSWTNSVADFDNDGDFDIFVTNHDFRHQWFVNDGSGFFTEQDISSGPVESFAFQGIVRDFDNNGYEDVLITGDAKNLLLLNDAGGSFNVINDPMPELCSSAVVGDINKDGWMDIVAFYSTNINFPGNKPDKIWINSIQSTNKYIDIVLEGVESNRLGIGAELRLYTNLGVMTRVVKGGESYGITNSYVQHFGLGSEPRIDSLVIDWPSGSKSIVFPQSLNRTYHLKEGLCISDEVDLMASQYFLCKEDSIAIFAPAGYQSYLWSNGLSGEAIHVKETGFYSVELIDSIGCLVRSDILEIEKGYLEHPLIIADNEATYCIDEDILVMAKQGGKNYLWSNTDTTHTSFYIGEELASLMVKDQCDNELFDTIYFNIVDPTIYSFSGDTVKKGEDAVLTAIGSNIYWYSNESSSTVLHNGNTFPILNASIPLDFYAEENKEVFAYKNEIGLDTISIIDGKFDDQSVDGLVLSTYEDLVMTEFTTNAFVSGWRKIEVLNKDFQIVDTQSVYMHEGWGTYKVDLELPRSEVVYITTDSVVNMLNFHTSSPLLMIEAENHFPLTYDFLSVISNMDTSNVYPYFFDIKIDGGAMNCISERVKIPLRIDDSVSTLDNELIYYSINPNPVKDVLYMNNVRKIQSINIYDLLGKVYINLNRLNDDGSIDVSALPNGIYWIVVLDTHGSIVSKKMVKG